MISDACFEVCQALDAPGIRPSAVERALNAFADDLDRVDLLAPGLSAVVAELRAGMAAVNKATLPPATFGAMARHVQRHFDSPQRASEQDLLAQLRSLNATATRSPFNERREVGAEPGASAA
jgi:hypothetical protein